MTEEIVNKNIAVWFSCGAASAVAAYLTVKKYGDKNNVMIFNNPVDEEDEDNRRFLNDVEFWIGRKIKASINSKVGHSSAEKIWTDRKYMSGNKGAPCTLMLKKQARYEQEGSVVIDYHVLGFTFNEENRHNRFIKYERENVLPVLIDEKLTKDDCFLFVLKNGIKLPRVYEFLDNANCIGCVKSSGIDYWQRIRKHYPIIFTKRCIQSRLIGCKLVRYKKKRIFLDELPVYAVGRKSKRKVDCSSFCETK